MSSEAGSFRPVATHIRTPVKTSSAKFHGRFDRADFIYIARDDEYLCSAGQRAIYRMTGEEHGM